MLPPTAYRSVHTTSPTPAASNCSPVVLPPDDLPARDSQVLELSCHSFAEVWGHLLHFIWYLVSRVLNQCISLNLNVFKNLL